MAGLLPFKGRFSPFMNDLTLSSLTLIRGDRDGLGEEVFESVGIELLVCKGLDGSLPLSTNVRHVVADDTIKLA